MSFFGLFGKENNFDHLNQVLSTHEEDAKKALHEKHPHVAPIFFKNGIDLRKIRRKKARTIAAASILGAFLAFPHLLGSPSFQEKPLPENVLVKDLSIAKTNSSHQQNSPSPTQVHTATSGANVDSNETQKPGGKSGEEHGHQGHLHGRSYLAPPKDHGLHDLGYHQGEEKNHDQVKSPLPHPEKPVESSRQGANK